MTLSKSLIVHNISECVCEIVNLFDIWTYMALAFTCIKGYPGQVKRNSLPFQVEATLKYLAVPLTVAHDCTSNQGWKTDRFLVPFRPGALFSVASYPRPGLSP